MLKTSPVVAYVPASDLDRARAFYEKTLGFEPKDPSPNGVTYPCAGGTRFFLYKTPGAGTSKASTAFWDVKDIEKTVADLRKKGIVFEKYDVPGLEADGDIYTGGGARAAWFKDTEGNIMAVIQAL